MYYKTVTRTARLIYSDIPGTYLGTQATGFPGVDVRWKPPNHRGSRGNINLHSKTNQRERSSQTSLLGWSTYSTSNVAGILLLTGLVVSYTCLTTTNSGTVSLASRTRGIRLLTLDGKMNAAWQNDSHTVYVRRVRRYCGSSGRPSREKVRRNIPFTESEWERE